MTNHKLDATLTALHALIEDTLRSDAKDRFARGKRLCELAQALMREDSTAGLSVHDPENMGDGFGMYDLQPMGGGAIRMTAPRIGAPYSDPGMPPIAEIMETLKPMLSAQATDRAASARADRASELNRLITARGELTDPDQRAVLNARICQIIEDIHHEEHDNADMVPAEFLRGHPAGIEADRPDAADDPGLVPGGEDGDARLVQAGNELTNAG